MTPSNRPPQWQNIFQTSDNIHKVTPVFTLMKTSLEDRKWSLNVRRVKNIMFSCHGSFIPTLAMGLLILTDLTHRAHHFKRWGQGAFIDVSWLSLTPICIHFWTTTTSTIKKESSILWWQGGFALLQCFMVCSSMYPLTSKSGLQRNFKFYLQYL